MHCESCDQDASPKLLFLACGHGLCMDCCRKELNRRRLVCVPCNIRQLRRRFIVFRADDDDADEDNMEDDDDNDRVAVNDRITHVRATANRRNPLNQFYVQGGMGAFGLATYWLDVNPAKSYIHYGQHVPWRLDNGQQPPDRIYFTHASYSHAERCFRGTIAWDVFNTGFGGDERWEYEMVFSADFGRIESGTVSKTPTGRVNRFGEQLRYELWPGTSALGRLDAMRVMLVLCSALDVPRLVPAGRRMRLLPRELLRMLRGFLAFD